MKKIISFFLVCFLLIPSMSSLTYANTDTHEYEIYKEMVLETSYGKYVDTLESSFSQISDEQLHEIYARVSVLTSANSDAQTLINFVMLLAEKELMERNSLSLMQNSLSPEEIQEAKNEILSLQSVVQRELLHLVENLTVSYEKMQYYSQEGDFSMNLMMYISEFMEYSLGMTLEDYTAETQGFDSLLESNFDINLELASTYESFDGNINGNVEFITLGGDIYLKAGDITYNASEMFEDEYGDIIEKLNQLAEDNTYLHYNDMSSEVILQVLESFSVSKLEKQMETNTEKEFFEAYARSGESYLLRPTQEFCSFMKESLSIFDPFGGKSCSQSQYEDMIEDMTNNGLKVKLTPGKNKLLSFTMDNEDVIGSIDMRYSNYGIIQFSGDFYEPENKEINHVVFDYSPNEYLNFNIDIEEMSLDGKLTFSHEGTLKAANIDMNVDQGNENIHGSLNYNRGRITTSVSGYMDRTHIDCYGEGYLTLINGNFSGNCSIGSTNYFGKKEQYDFSLESNYDFYGNKNDIDFALDFTGGENMNFSLDFKNIGSKKKIDARDIQAPEKTENYFNSIYGDFYNDDIYYDEYEIDTKEYDDYSETCYNYENGDYSCTKYYYNNSNTETCSFYIDYDEEEECTKSTFTEYDDYSETCYIYSNGDTSCYKDSDTVTETCYFTAETGEEECSSYDYGYEVIENEYEDYSETCYIYNSGTTDCTKYYEDKTEYCYEYIDTPEDNYCSIQTDEYYYDGYSDIYYYDDYQIDGATGERTDY